jgi:hypothetical protein
MKLINRIKHNWNFTRILFVVMGTIITVQAFTIMQWPGIFLGAYFLSMGIFAFGCAAGNCYVPMDPQNKAQVEDISYTEVK